MAAFLWLGGCASTVKTNLASYGTPDRLPKGQSVALIPADSKKADSLEFQHYKDQVAKRLVASGYKIVEPSQKPDFIAEFDYSIMPPRQQTTYYYQRPVFGPFGGFAYGYRSGPWRRHSYRSTYLGYAFPLGGDYEERRSYTKTYYDRSVSLFVHKPGETSRLYESKIEGSSICGKLEPVMGALIDHMFAHFPKTGEESQTITLPGDSC